MESLLYSFLAGVSTVFGAVAVMIFGMPGKNFLSGMLGFAAGVMLAISFFDLMPEALAHGSMTSTVIGFLLGVVLMYFLDRFIPHMHLSSNGTIAKKNKQAPAADNKILQAGYLIFLGIALHNIPEGLAIGAGLEASPELGLYIAIALGLHNIPEGAAVAGPLRAGGLPVAKVVFLTLIAGLMSPVGAALGLVFINISPLFIAGSLSFAAGAMVYIANDELIPRSHKLNSHAAIGGVVFGLLLVFILSY